MAEELVKFCASLWPAGNGIRGSDGYIVSQHAALVNESATPWLFGVPILPTEYDYDQPVCHVLGDAHCFDKPLPLW